MPLSVVTQPWRSDGGALTYMPGTHSQYFLTRAADGTMTQQPQREPPWSDDPLIRVRCACLSANCALAVRLSSADEAGSAQLARTPRTVLDRSAARGF